MKPQHDESKAWQALRDVVAGWQNDMKSWQDERKAWQEERKASLNEERRLHKENKDQAVRVAQLEVLSSFPIYFNGVLSAHYYLERRGSNPG